MNQTIYYFKERTDLVDKLLIVSTSFIPLFLAISIFAADLLASICSLIVIYFFFFKKNLNIFKIVKKEIFFFFNNLFNYIN